MNPANVDRKPEPKAEKIQPPPGSWADVARMMATNDDSGFDWDQWKDTMKDQNG